MSHPYIEATDQTFDEQVLTYSGVALVDFWATWCGPCQMLGPIIERLAEKYKDDATVRIVKVDVDQNPLLAEKYQVFSIPAIKFFRGGEIVDEVSGVAPEAELTRRLDAAKG